MTMQHKQRGFGLIETLLVLALVMVILIVALREDDRLIVHKSVMQTRSAAHQIMSALSVYYHQNCQSFPYKGTANPTTYVPIAKLQSQTSLSKRTIQNQFGNKGNSGGFTASIVYKSSAERSGQPPAYYMVVTADLSGIKDLTKDAGAIDTYRSLLGADYSVGTSVSWVHLPYQNIPQYGNSMSESNAYGRSFALDETNPNAQSNVNTCLP